MIRLVHIFKRKPCYNRLSNHYWTELIPTNKMEVVCSMGFHTTFTSETKAKEFIKTQIAWEEKINFNMPRSQRELDKAKKLGL